jgi:flavin-dependent dehydrogenase
MNPFGSGFHLERGGFDQLVRDAVDKAPASVHGLLKANFKSVEKANDGEGWLVHIDSADGTSTYLQTRWIVDATGRKASVATKASFT